jgi:peptide chain release factor 1
MFKEKLQPFIDRHNEITELLSSPDIASDISRMTKLSKEQSGLNELVEKANLYIETADAIDENKELLGDAELGDLAKEELSELEPMLPALESEIKVLMLPKDKNDDKNILLELRAGAGGDEAMVPQVDIKKLSPKYQVKMFMLFSNMRVVSTVYNVYPIQKHKDVCILLLSL